MGENAAFVLLLVATLTLSSEVSVAEKPQPAAERRPAAPRPGLLPPWLLNSNPPPPHTRRVKCAQGFKNHIYKFASTHNGTAWLLMDDIRAILKALLSKIT